ncbi:MAG: DUF7507 domain-containing protein [Planctomycetota bacterium]
MPTLGTFIDGPDSTDVDAAACAGGGAVPFDCTGEAFTVRYSPAELFLIDQTVSPFTFNVIDLNGPSGIEGNVAQLFIPAGIDGSLGEIRPVELNNLGFRTTDGMLYAMALKVFVEGNSAQNGNYGIVKIDSAGNIFPVAVPAPAPIPGIGNNAFRFPAGEITPDGSTMYINAQVTNDTADPNTANRTLYKVDLDTLVVTPVQKTIDAGAISIVNVADWAVNPLDGMLYGGAPQVSPARIWQLNPDTGEMTIVPGSGAIGLPNGTGTLDAFGGAWFNAAGHLFLYRNVGEIYEVDLDSSTPVGGCDTGPCPELLSIQFGGPTSTFNDATACTGAPVVFPDIDIQKTPDFQAVESGGDAAFTITVTNTGDVALTNVTVTDPMVADCNGFIGDLAIGETVAYDCNAINVTEGFTNTACVEGTAGQATVTDCDDAVVGVPAIDILKKPDLQVVAFGGDVTFTIIVTNTGSVDLTDVTVTDLLAPDCNNLIGDLAAGESVVYDCTVTNVTEDFTNTACVEGTTPDQTTVTDCNDADVVVVVVECPAVPAIDIQKTPDLQTVESGANADFTITVTNTGNVDLTDVIVSDPWAPDCNNIIGDLAASDSVTYNCTVTNVTEDFTNIACVAGMADQTTVTSCDDADVVVVAIPGIEILKKPDLQVLESGGGDATFTIIVTNTGNVDLTDVTVTDPLAPDCNNLIGDLAAGESFVYDCTVTNVTEDFTNTATVTGTVNGSEVSDSDTAEVVLDGCSEGCTPGYWKNHLDAWVGFDPGDSFEGIFFGVDLKGKLNNLTLEEGLSLLGGEKNSLIRHAIAALLNSTSDLYYLYTPEEVIAMVQCVFNDTENTCEFNNGEYELLKEQFEAQNQYCPLN